MRMIARTLAAGTALLAASVAMAQDPSVPQRGQDADPKLPPPKEQIPEKVQPESGDGRTLSEKLDQSDGVIKPPSEVDPEIKTVPPDPGPNSMPVIKPPGDAK